MITIEKIDTDSKAQIRRFVRMPFRIYEKDSQWVPPILIDQEGQLDKHNFPFYEHSEADFFIAVRDGQDVGRIAAIHNRPFNRYHGTHFFSWKARMMPKSRDCFSSALSNGRVSEGWIR